MSLSAPQARQGKVKILAVASRRRAAQLPGVPTIAEAGYPDFEALLFSSMLAPAGTPPAIVHRMSEEAGKILRAPDLQKRLADMGAEPEPGTPEEFAAMLRSEGERWGKLIRDKNIRAD